LFCFLKILLCSSFVITTGDIVDGLKYSFPSIAGEQHQEEWESYRQVLDDSGLGTTDFWFDFPGNHDLYGTLEYTDSNYFAKNYTVQSLGKDEFLQEYIHVHNAKQYRFLFLEANVHPSATIMFEGYLNSEQIETLKEKIDDGNEYEHTFIPNHYPLSLIVTDLLGTELYHSLEDQLRNTVTASLSGHLHVTCDVWRKFYLEMTTRDLKVAHCSEDHCLL
jgi:hypothetical protein